MQHFTAKEIQQRYYIKNREKILKRVSEYSRKNKDKIKEYKKRWWLKDADRQKKKIQAIRTETLKECMPEEKIILEKDWIDYVEGFNDCLKMIKRNAKEKFNIKI